MANVDTTESRYTIANIKASCEALYDALDPIYALNSQVKDLESQYVEKNNTGVDGSKNVSKTTTPHGKDESNPVTKTTTTWETWVIPNDGLGAIIDQFHSPANDLISVTGDLKSILADCDESMDIIEEARSAMEAVLADVDPALVKDAFAALSGTAGGSSLIAWDEYKANAGEFISADKILTPYWVDSQLTFVKQANGTYLIMQDGVGMGFTTVSGMMAYLGAASKIVYPKSTKTESNSSTTRSGGSAADYMDEDGNYDSSARDIDVSSSDSSATRSGGSAADYMDENGNYDSTLREIKSTTPTLNITPTQFNNVNPTLDTSTPIGSPPPATLVDGANGVKEPSIIVPIEEKEPQVIKPSS